MAKKKVNLATEDYVNNLVNHVKNNLDSIESDVLQTEDKTIVGAINEIYKILSNFTSTDFDIKAQMYYGILDPQVVGTVQSFKDVTIDMLSEEHGIIATKPGERSSLPLGYVKEGMYIVIAIPVLYNLVASKDNGFGAKTNFDESIVGANGIDIVLEDQDYRIYGEFILIGGDRTIYIDRVESAEEDYCDCPEITDGDIDSIIDSLED